MRIYPVIFRTTVFLPEIPHKVQLVTSLSSFYSQVHVNKSRKTHLHTDSRLGQSRGPRSKSFRPPVCLHMGLIQRKCAPVTVGLQILLVHGGCPTVSHECVCVSRGRNNHSPSQ